METNMDVKRHMHLSISWAQFVTEAPIKTQGVRSSVTLFFYIQEVQAARTGCELPVLYKQVGILSEPIRENTAQLWTLVWFTR